LLVAAALWIMAKAGNEWAKDRLADLKNFIASFASKLDIPEAPDPSKWTSSTVQPDKPNIPGGDPKLPHGWWPKLIFILAKLADIYDSWPRK
jgi:hypothetical protein